MRTFFIISFALFFLTIPSVALAQQAATPSAFEDKVDAPSTYTLPYPGMLPDNPFYSVKMMRDRIVLFLISDSLKKAQFHLLQADKRLQAGMYLWNEDNEKAELVISTISKGENYFEQALFLARQAKKEGRDVDPLVGDLEQAARKHTEVLGKLREEMPSPYRQEIVTLQKRTQGFEQNAKNIKLLPQ